MYRSSRRRGGADVYMTLLLAQLVQRIAQLEYKPPLTLAIIGACFMTFFNDILPWQLRSFIPSVSKACLNPYMIFQNQQWGRLFWAAFLHADEMHLYYNMSSMLWKGAQLERRYGTCLFGVLLLELLLLSHGLFAALAWLAAYYVPEYSHLYLHTCTIGISAVLFALKVLLNHGSPASSSIMGITLPTKYMAWAELLLASALNPHASFLGHLAGILAGLLHVHVLAPVLPALVRRLRAVRLQARIRLRPGQGRFAAGSSSGTWSGGAARPAHCSAIPSRPPAAAAAAASQSSAAAVLLRQQAAGVQQSSSRRAAGSEYDRGHRLGSAAAGDEVLVHSSSAQPSEELRTRTAKI